MSEEKMEKLSKVYLSGQAMFTELGRALKFNGIYGWHMIVKGGFVEVCILSEIKAEGNR